MNDLVWKYYGRNDGEYRPIGKIKETTICDSGIKVTADIDHWTQRQMYERLIGLYSNKKENNMDIKKVIYSGPATIVIWGDDTKTIVKCSENDEYDPEKGLAMAICKKALGGNYRKTFDKWTMETDDISYKEAFEGLEELINSFWGLGKK